MSPVLKPELPKLGFGVVLVDTNDPNYVPPKTTPSEELKKLKKLAKKQVNVFPLPKTS